MNISRYRKKIQIKKNSLKWAAGAAAAVCLAGMIFFFTFFKVEKVEVMGNSHYTETEVREMVLTGAFSDNSVLAPILYTKDSVEDVPFVEGYSVTRMNRSTICISVKEVKPVGCIPYLDSYIYFDRNGIFVESARERDETVPYFGGIEVEHVIKGQELPIKGTTVLNTAVALATIFQKNEMLPDYIQFDENDQVSLVYGDITVMLGPDEFLEDKMARVTAILPMISGRKGILHAESVTESVKTITFEEAQEEQTELDYAIAAWEGGYDEEGDYTGTGEYDQYGNYAGPYPTQEILDAKGDWTGGYTESGSYNGYSEFDREGNYVGPNPNEESYDENYEDYYEEDYYEEDYYEDDYYYDDGY